LVMGPSLISKTYAFILNVRVVDKPFGDSSAYVEVKGPDGYDEGNWYNWVDIKTGITSGMVTLDLPDDSFPIGGEYKVCASSKVIFNALIPNCHSLTYKSDPATVTVSLR
jgi:hypothetical protein